MLANVGVAKSSIVVCTLILGVSIIPTVMIQAFGISLRGQKRSTELDQEQIAESK
jgi:hypothetical protein